MSQDCKSGIETLSRDYKSGMEKLSKDMKSADSVEEKEGFWSSLFSVLDV